MILMNNIFVKMEENRRNILSELRIAKKEGKYYYLNGN